MHFEVELGVIMGKTVRDLDPQDTKGALDAIEGASNFVQAILHGRPVHCSGTYQS